MSDSPKVYNPQDYFYLDLISHAIFKQVISQEKFKDLLLRGSHLTRSLLFEFGDEKYKFSRNPKDMDFFLHIPDDIIPQDQAIEINHDNRRVASAEFIDKYNALIDQLVFELKKLDYELKFTIAPISIYNAKYPFEGEISIRIKLAESDIQVVKTWEKEPYPSRKLKFDALIEVENQECSKSLQYEYSIDVGSGDPLVCPPTRINVIFPGLSPELSVKVSGVTVSTLTAFKLHSSIEIDFDWRIKDFYDLDLLIPHVDPHDSHFKANLYLAFASQGDPLIKIRALVVDRHDSYLFSAWSCLIYNERLEPNRTKFEPVMKRLASFLRLALL